MVDVQAKETEMQNIKAICNFTNSLDKYKSSASCV